MCQGEITDRMADTQNDSPIRMSRFVKLVVNIVYFFANTVTKVMSDIAVPIILKPKENVGATLQMLRFLYLLGST